MIKTALRVMQKIPARWWAVSLVSLGFVLTITIPSVILSAEKHAFEYDQQTALHFTEVLRASDSPQTATLHTAQDVLTRLATSPRWSEITRPKSRDTAFYYLAEHHRIVIADAASIVQGEVALLHRDITFTVPSQPHFNEGGPESVLGEGIIILSQEGSLLAELVHAIHTAANHQNYEEIHAKFTKASETCRWFCQIQSRAQCIVTRQLLRVLLDYYAPERTLFVSDTTWYTAAHQATHLRQIVFTPGITKIPSFTLNGLAIEPSTPIVFEHLMLPHTIESIDSGALPKTAFTITTLKMPSIFNMTLLPDAITAVDTILWFDRQEATLTDFSSDVELYVDASGRVEFAFGTLLESTTITRFEFEVDGAVVLARFYDEEQLIGYARNVYTVHYYLDEADRHPYRIVSVLRRTFFDMSPLQREGYLFQGWYLDPDQWSQRLREGNTLPAHTIDVYARWRTWEGLPPPGREPFE